MQFLESLQEPLTLEQLKQAEEEIEAQKKDWELGRLKAIKEEEERRAGYRDDEEAPALVYSREDAYTQVPKSGRERRSSRGGSGGVGGGQKWGCGCTSATDRIKPLDRNASAIKPPPHSTTEKIVRGEKDLSVERTLSVTKVLAASLAEKSNVPAEAVFRPASKAQMLEKGLRMGSKGTMPTTRVRGSEPVGNHVGDAPITEKPHTSNSPSRTKVQPPNSSGGSPTVLKPFSNPNLVIRTRRARAAETNSEAVTPKVVKTEPMQLPPERPVPVFESVKVKVEVPEEAAEKQTVSDEVVTDPVLDEHREIVEEMIEEIVVDESVEEMSVDVIEEMAIEQNVDSLAVEEMGAQKGIEVVAEGIVKDETAEHVVLAGGEEEMALSEEYNLEEEQVYEFVLDPELCEEIGPDLLAEFVSKLTPELFSRLAAGEMDAEGGEGPNTRALEICVEKAEEEKGVLQSLVEVQEVEEENVVEIYISMNGHEQMPIWAPPTPPQEENDLYIDYSVGFLYEPSVMSESSLPAVYIKKEAKRLKVDPLSTVTAARKQKSRKEDAVHIPKSLFDRPTAAILKMRREAKLQKVKNLMQGGFMAARPILDLSPDTPEWLIHEDWAILQVIQQLQDIPLNLTVLTPGHTPNWDLVADVVNTVSRIYRSPKQCKDRYENIIVPREEGKILYDTNPKKQKKTKGIYKTKNNKPMRTGQLFSQDCNQAFTMLYNTRFDTIRAVASKRTPTLKPSFTANPLEKQKSQLAAAAVAAEAQRQQQAQQHQQGQPQVAGQPAQQASVQTLQQPTAVAATAQAVTGGQGAAAVVAAAANSNVTTVALAKSGGILVSTAVTATTAASGGVVSAAPTFALTKVPVTAVATLSTAALRPQRPQPPVVTATTTMTVQEMVAVATGQVRGLPVSSAITTAGGSTPAVVSVTNLGSAQLQPVPQRISTVTAVSQVAAAQGQQTAITRNLTEAEMAQLLKRRELQQKQVRAQRTPVATLVKTVSAPSALGPSQTAVTIPVSAVTMAGVNINVSLAQQGKVNASKPTTTASVTPQQMQMRQLQIQQQLLQQQQQQRKVTLQTQQKVASLSQAQMPAGKAPTVATQLGTVQIVQQGSAQGAKTTTLPSATAITVQQIIKQVLPVNQNFLMSSAMQAAAGSSSGATTVSPATQVQLHAMLHKPAVSTVALAAPTAVSSGATAATLVPTRIMALQQPPGQPATVALKQGLQPSTSDQQPAKRGGAPSSQSAPDSGRL
ncbi:hypothetical protein MRX96_018452 [Rhipicephalus microplus]